MHLDTLGVGGRHVLWPLDSKVGDSIDDTVTVCLEFRAKLGAVRTSRTSEPSENYNTTSSSLDMSQNSKHG